MKAFTRRVSGIIPTVVLAFSGLTKGADTTGTSPVADSSTVVLTARAIRQAATFHQEPEYPAAARQFHLSGEVVVEFIVGLDGKVENVTITRGQPILNDAVTRALKKWSFTPLNVDGRPRKMKSTLSFNFTL